MKKKKKIFTFTNNQLEPGEKYKDWLEAAKFFKLNSQERLRVNWMIFFEKEAKKNVIKTCNHFGISRKTFYKWLNRFSNSRQDIKSLKNISSKPKLTRGREVSIGQERRITQLRKKYPHYGKKKLKVLYSREYGEEISCWKIEKVIRKKELYPNKDTQKKMDKKPVIVRMKPIKNFTKFEKEKGLWFLFQMCTLVIYLTNTKRYIITAVDYNSKVAYARMYETKNPRVVNDFLNRVNHFIEQSFDNIKTSNDRKLVHFFEPTISELKSKKHFKWVKKPEKNLKTERFNTTFKWEWLLKENIDLNCNRFNKNLTSYLIEYNFNRPHQSLNYLTPIEYIQKESMECHLKNKVILPDLVKRVMEYVSKLDIQELEALSVESISMDFGINRTKLWRSFKKEKNMCPKEFLFRIKINQAAILLREKPDLTVKEIAEKTGFFCYGYFFQIFKKHFGTTPGKFRKIKRPDDGLK